LIDVVGWFGIPAGVAVDGSPHTYGSHSLIKQLKFAAVFNMH